MNLARLVWKRIANSRLYRRIPLDLGLLLIITVIFTFLGVSVSLGYLTGLKKYVTAFRKNAVLMAAIVAIAIYLSRVDVADFKITVDEGSYTAGVSGAGYTIEFRTKTEIINVGRHDGYFHGIDIVEVEYPESINNLVIDNLDFKLNSLERDRLRVKERDEAAVVAKTYGGVDPIVKLVEGLNDVDRVKMILAFKFSDAESSDLASDFKKYHTVTFRREDD
jgi:hypothetical protein